MMRTQIRKRLLALILSITLLGMSTLLTGYAIAVTTDREGDAVSHGFATISEAPEGNALAFTASKATAANGETFDVVLSLTTDTPIASVEINLDYDGSAIQLSYEDNEWMKDGEWIADRLEGLLTPFDPLGLGRITMSARGVNPQGDCDNLATLRFTVLDYSKPVTIKPAFLRITDVSGTVIEYSIVPAIVNAENNPIPAARNRIESQEYTDTQENVGNITEAHASVEAIIGGLDINGVAVEVIDGVFTPAVAGIASNIAGIDGSYTFTAKLTSGAFPPQTTKELTLVIKATPHDGQVPFISLTGPETVAYKLGAKATYTLTTANMPDLNIVIFTISFEYEFFTPDSFSITPEFTLTNGITTDGITKLDWQQVGNRSEAIVELMRFGGPYGPQFSDGDLFEITFLLNDVQDGRFATVECFDFLVATSTPVTYIYPSLDTVALTQFTQPYPKFDFNSDGFVDWLDLSFLLDYFMVAEGDIIWPQAQMYDVNGDGIIDLEDLILVRSQIS